MPPSEPPETVAFGRFRISPQRRELIADGRLIKLGGRAFDVLMALIETPGAVVGKDALMARVWPDRVVEENSLQAQILALRKAFGAERDLIRTVVGRGYQFIGNIQHPAENTGPGRAAVRGEPSPAPATNLPESISELIGRDEELGEILNLAAAHRLVTLTGAGGIGKTTLALALARELRPHFAEGVWLAALSTVGDPGLVPAAVATAVGLELAGGEVSARRVAQALAGRHLLLVLDTCEHVIDAAAEFAEAVLSAGSTLHIVATSREPLRAAGEWVYPVRPLAVPAIGAAAEDDSFADDPLQYGAVRLFIERARAAEAHFVSDRRSAARIGAICRRLDGIPLAIELAAARAATLGIEEVFARLDDLFGVLAGGRRTALPRHQTLRATLDWSYGLLPQSERVLLRRLAIFAGAFSVNSACAVAASADLPALEAVDALAGLVAKSLVAVNADSDIARYWLLDTTRAYALEKLDQAGERDRLARRLAEFARDRLEFWEVDLERRLATEELADFARLIDNLRAALDWAFSSGGDTEIGVALAASAVPLWLHLSLMQECRGRAEQALAVLGTGLRRDARREVKLYAALATSLTYTGGTPSEVEAAWTRTLDVAEELDDVEYQLRAAWEMWTINRNIRWHRLALTNAEKFGAVTANRGDPDHRLVAERMLGIAHHYVGDQAAARQHLEAVVSGHVESDSRSHIIRFQVDLRVSARTFLAPVLWLLGFPDQALRAAEAAIEDAQAANHALSVCHALVFGACPTALLAGDLEAGERYAGLLLDFATKHGLARWHAYSSGYRGALLIKRGEVAAGLQLMRAGVEEMGARGFATLRFMDFVMPEALSRAGDVTEALAAVEGAIARSNENEERRFIAELLRIKGEILLRQNDRATAVSAAENLFRQALDWARRQGALSWELRAATSLARLHARRRSGDAASLLQSVYDRFTEGFDTADVKSAKTLLEDLRP